jgi:flagellin-like protein
MKRVWKKNDKEAVSPVIATILMVAITVVLAAVLYMMVMNPDQTEPNVFGNLYYKHDVSSPESGVAVFDLTMSAPSDAKIEDITVKVVSPNQQVVAGAQINWTHLVSDEAHIQGGDRLVVTVPGVDISGCEVALSATGYTGTISGKIST